MTTEQILHLIKGTNFFAILGPLLILGAGFLWRRWRMARGIYTEELHAQFNLLLDDPEDGRPVLLIRSIAVPGYGAIQGILSNKTLARWVMRSAYKVQWPNPLVKLGGRNGRSARASIVGKVAGANQFPVGKKDNYYVFITCENVPDEVDRKVRLFLVHPKTLAKFTDPNWVNSLKLERDFHVWRIRALEEIAKTVASKNGWTTIMEINVPEPAIIRENLVEAGPYMHLIR